MAFMHQRQRSQHAFLAGAQSGQAAYARVPAAGVQEIAVGQDAALGPAGGAGRVQQRAFAQLARLAAGQRRGEGRGGRRVVRTHHAQLAAGARGRQVSVAAGQGHGQRDFGVAGQVFEFGGAQVGIDRHHRHAQRVEREPVQEEGGAVFQQQAGAVAVAVAGARIGGA